MAITKIINEKEYVFPDGTTEEQILAFEEQILNPDKKPDEQKPEEEEKRGYITDTAYGAAVGIRNAGQSILNLGEGIGQDLKKKFGVGGFTFGENANNGMVEYHTYEDVIKNKIKLPLTGDVTKVGDKDSKLKLPEMDAPDTGLGNVTSVISQFVSGWYLTKPLKAVSWATKGSKAVKATKATGVALTRGAVADFVAFDQDTGRAVDMINTHFPSLQNPLFDYLSSEDKDEGFYEARFKNALEGLFLGGVTEGIIRGTKPFLNQISDFAKYVRIKRKELKGAKVDLKKLKEVEESLVRSTEDTITPVGKESTKKFKKKILKESDSAGTTKLVEQLKKITSAEELNTKIVQSFDNYLDKIRSGERTVRAKRKGTVDYKNIDDFLDFGLSPRAYADSNFGIIAINAMQKIARMERKFEKISIPLIEKYATKAGFDIIHTSKMLGQLGDKMESGLKYMYASQAIQQNLADAVYKMANSVRKADGVYSDKELKITTAMLMKLMRFDDKVTSNLGRGLNLRRILKDQNVDLSAESIKNFVKRFDDFDGNFDEFVDGIALIKDKNMLIRITDFLFRNNFWNKMNEVWMASALSLPKTQVINVTSTLMNSYIKPLNSWVGSKMAWGLDKSLRDQVKAQGDEALATMAGLKNYYSDAIQFMKKAFNDEDSILFAGSTKFDTNVKALGNSKLARAIRYPLRALTAADEFFKQINYRSKLAQISVREARAAKTSTTKVAGTLPNGKTVTEFEAFVANRFKQGFDETGLVAMDKEASRYAKEVTFTSELDGVLKYISEATNEVPILKQILPFVKTPANLAIQATQMTPFGIVGKNWKHITGKSRDFVMIAQTRGRVAVGTTILGMAAFLANAGIITGGGHPDKSIRRNQKNAGYQPYSIKIGNAQFEYGRLDPIGMLIGTVADYVEIYQDLNDRDRENIEKNLLSFMVNQMEGGHGEDSLTTGDKVANMSMALYKSMFKNIASKTYLRGLIDFLSALDGNDVDKRGMWWINNKGSSYVPNLLTKVMNDPYLRETQTTLEAFRRRLGDTSLPVAYNYLGEEIKSTGNAALRMFNGLVNPFTFKTRENDIVLQKTIEHDIAIPPISFVKEGIDLREFVNSETGKTAYEEYNELISNSNLRKQLEKLVTSKRFDEAPNRVVLDKNNKFGGKQAMVYKKVKFYRDLFFKQIRHSSKYKSKQNSEITLASAYINKNIITRIGKVSNKLPTKIKKGIYDFIQSSP